MSRSRSYCFTINNYSCSDLADIIIMCDYAKYVIVGFEVGSQGTPHIQGYVYFENAKTLSRMRKFISGHITISNGNPKQNYDYCSKDGIFWEHGIIPSQGKATFEAIEAVMKDPESNFHLYQQYKKTYKEYKRSVTKEQDRQLWICSSNLKFDLASKFQSVCFDNWDECYDEEECLFLSCYNVYPLDNWLHGHPPKVKRGYEIIPIDPRIIIILYNDVKEMRYLQKKYSHCIVDKCLVDSEDLEKLVEGCDLAVSDGPELIKECLQRKN